MEHFNLITPINQLGYGVTGLNVAKSLSKLGRVALWPLGNVDCPQEDAESIIQLIKNNQLPNFSAPCLRIWHQNDMSQFVGSGTRAGFPIFELDTFTELEKAHLSQLDSLIVCSDWARKVCLENGVVGDNSRPVISVAPLGVDGQVFKPHLSTRKTTVFFNCGKWEIRKGHDLIVDAFNQAFTPEDDVELWMMCGNPFFSDEENDEWEQLYLKSPLGSKVKIISRQPTQKEVYNIMRETDCGVFPARAEGWNLELLEMLSCGKHIIATDYSGHTEFCNHKNTLLLNVNDTEEAFDGKWFHGQGRWARLTDKETGHVASLMKSVHRTKQSGSLPMNEEGIKTANQFSWENTAEKIRDALTNNCICL